MERIFSKRCVYAVILSMVSSIFTGCDGNKQLFGTIGGGAVGAALGSQVGGGRGRIWGTALGAVLGAALGSQIGKALDEGDKAAMASKTSEALESTPAGRCVSWKNPDTGNYGEIIPQQASYDTQGRPCRRFTQKAWIEGRLVEIHGMAYRGSDGCWHMVQ